MQQTQNYLKLSPEDQAKVEKARTRKEAEKLSVEWAFVGRFGFYFGWQGVEAIRNNEIDLEEATMLLRGAEKVHASHVIDIANATYVASVASRIKKGVQYMRKALGSYISESRGEN